MPRALNQNSYISEKRILFMGNSSCAKGHPGERDYLGVQVHEYAHSVFSPNFNSRFSEAILATAGNSMERFKLIISDQASLADADAVVADIVTVSLPFNELFADAVAVLILDDPQAVSRFFQACEGKAGDRDFSAEYPVAGWNVGPLGGLFDRRHEVFNPTRTYLWKVYSTRFKNQKNGAARIVRALFDASADVIQAVYEKRTTYGQWANVNQEALNRDLIDALNARLGERD